MDGLKRQKSLSVYFAFPRSGGTLLNRILGINPNFLVLSEVNPAGSFLSIEYQAEHWLRLVDKDSLASFSELDYVDQIEYLWDKTHGQHKNLIIRDWSAVNFIPGVNRGLSVPSGILEQYLYLVDHGFNINPVVLCRRSRDIFESMRRVFPQFKDLSAENFVDGYLKFVEAVKNFKKIQLENIRKTPLETLGLCFRHLRLPDDALAEQIDNFSKFVECTGDNTLTQVESKSREDHILSIEMPSSPNQQSDHVQKVMNELDELMGYTANA